MLPNTSLSDLHRALTTSALTVRALTELYLERIEAIDRGGPRLNAVIEVNPDALEMADALDAELKAQGPRGPLHGVPVLLKDNIDTGDRMQTTAGSLALAGVRAREDAGVAQRLRAAGALLLGKTNLSEWANFRSTRSSSGWSSRGGQTRNAYVLDRNPSGSSSGSAAAVAAALCAVAVGTETDGSIVSPAQTNGIVGLKPTVGLVSRAGIIPIAASQDTAGPMARSVADAALLLGALAGVDPRDPATAGSAGYGYSDYTQFLRPDGARGLRIGVARAFFGSDERVNALMRGVLETLKGLGAELIDPADVPQPAEAGEAELAVLLYEFKAGLNAYLAGLGPQAAVHSLAEVIDFNTRHASTVMPLFGQERLELAEAKGPLSSDEYLKAVETCRRLSRTEGLDKVLAEHRLDALVAPSGGPAWLIDHVNGDSFAAASGGNTSAAAVAGYPHLTVPAGQVCGLPVGVSFMGGAYQEPKLLRLAYAFEQATPAPPAPRFLPTAEV
jgi:amidase